MVTESHKSSYKNRNFMIQIWYVVVWLLLYVIFFIVILNFFISVKDGFFFVFMKISYFVWFWQEKLSFEVLDICDSRLRFRRGKSRRKLLLCYNLASCFLWVLCLKITQYRLNCYFLCFLCLKDMKFSDFFVWFCCLCLSTNFVFCCSK